MSWVCCGKPVLVGTTQKNAQTKKKKQPTPSETGRNSFVTEMAGEKPKTPCRTRRESGGEKLEGGKIDKNNACRWKNVQKARDIGGKRGPWGAGKGTLFTLLYFYKEKSTAGKGKSAIVTLTGGTGCDGVGKSGEGGCRADQKTKTRKNRDKNTWGRTGLVKVRVTERRRWRKLMGKNS